MGLSTNTYTYAGGAQTFLVSFALGFLTRTDVQVRVNSAVDGSGDPAYAAFTWDDDTQITVTDTLTIGDSVEVVRTVSKTELQANFAVATDVTPANLDISAKQGLMVYQELIDGRVAGTESPIVAADRAVAAANAAFASAAEALVSEDAAAVDAVRTAADVVLTGADVTSTGLDVASTNADVVATNADVAATNADVVSTGNDAISTADDVVTTNADVVLTGDDVTSTGAHAVSTTAAAAAASISAAEALVSENASAADAVLTAADVVLTHADVVLTGLDVDSTNADVVLTHADVVLTGLDVASTNADVVLTGADVTSTDANVVSAAAAAAAASISAAAALVSENASADLDQGVATTDSPTFAGVDVTGSAEITNATNNTGGLIINSTGTDQWGLEIGVHSALSESDLVFNSNAVIGVDSNLNVALGATNLFKVHGGATDKYTGVAGATEVFAVDGDTGDVTIGGTLLAGASSSANIITGDLLVTESVGDAFLTVRSTGTGDADATLRLDAADTGESIVEFMTDSVKKADITWFDTGSSLILRTLSGTNSSIVLQPDDVTTLELETNGSVKMGPNVPDAFPANNTSGKGAAWSEASGVFGALNEDSPSGAFGRWGTEGEVVRIYHGGSLRGNIGTGSNDLVIDGGSGHTGIRFATTSWAPRDNGVDVNDAVDLGNNTWRFDDIYATNGAINISDENEKQEIVKLSPELMKVAARISKEFVSFKWNSAVENKGNQARSHFGTIAQRVEEAFYAEGLNPWDYGVITMGSWMESTDSEGVVTRYDPTDEDEVIPEGAELRTLLGVRYNELQSFITAYHEQRFTALEDRLLNIEELLTT